MTVIATRQLCSHFPSLSQTAQKAWVSIWNGVCESLQYVTPTEIKGKALNNFLRSCAMFYY